VTFAPLTVLTYDGDVLGTITAENGVLMGSDPGTDGIAKSALRRCGGDVQQAYRQLDGFQNGYILISSDPAERVSEVP
jgi:hypothetical protein